MIGLLRLQNFKCFEDQSLTFAPLTLLSGLNGMGKSSVIQSLLVLRQSANQGLLDKNELALNGDLVCLGTARDALYEGAKEDSICLEISDTLSRKERWCFHYLEADANVLVLDESRSDTAQSLNTSLFGRDFHYINAERTGPRTSFEISDSVVRQHKQLGSRGEYTAHFLSVFGRDEIPNPALAHSQAKSLNLRDQVEAWLGEVSPGTRLHFTSHAGMDIVNLQYSFVTGQQVSNEYRATNVGFGLTYTLPILVAILSSPKGALILCENPEAHLHPKGQALMGELMSLAANCGIQVVTETHSDHVLNGIRLSIYSGKIEPDDVRLHFFQRREKDEQARNEVISPHIDRDGRINIYPEGFFDQWEKSLEALLEPREV
jgi:predicted ATPase